MPTAQNSNPSVSSAAAPARKSSLREGCRQPREGETVIQKKEENGEKYVTATTEAEFHEALNRGFAVEVTRKLADEIGVPMNEHVGTVAEIDAGAEGPSRGKKSFWRRGEDETKSTRSSAAMRRGRSRGSRESC